MLRYRPSVIEDYLVWHACSFVSHLYHFTYRLGTNTTDKITFADTKPDYQPRLYVIVSCTFNLFSILIVGVKPTLYLLNYSFKVTKGSEHVPNS